MHINIHYDRPLTVVILLLLLVISRSHSAVLMSGDFQTGSPTPTLTFTNDISFEITASGTATFLVFDEWVVSDGTLHAVSFPTSPSVQNIDYTLNGGSLASAQAFQLYDNNASVFGDITDSDGVIVFSSLLFDVTTGDTLTISAATYTFTFNPDFNSAIPSVFQGNVFIADDFGNQISSLTPVPEPAGAAMIGLLSFIIVMLRAGKLWDRK